MSLIIRPEIDHVESPEVIRAQPEIFKAFWPEVKGSYYFRDRRVYLDFLRHQGGKIFYLPGRPAPTSPFVLVGNWRSRDDITAIWHIKAEGADKENLVLGAAWACFGEGAERMVTKLLNQSDAAEYGRWGFEVACRIVLLEKHMYREPPPPGERDGVKIVHTRKRAFGDVLRVDTTAFDDFWRLDPRTIEAIASSCTHNVFLLAQRGGETLGYTMGGVNRRLGYLQRLGVHARYQGTGIGHSLASHLLHDLYRLGANTVMVNTQDDNLAALNLYRDLGFGETQEPRLIMQYTARGADRGRR